MGSGSVQIERQNLAAEGERESVGQQGRPVVPLVADHSLRAMLGSILIGPPIGPAGRLVATWQFWAGPPRGVCAVAVTVTPFS